LTQKQCTYLKKEESVVFNNTCEWLVFFLHWSF
jgi:hypothetical protein